MKTSKANKQARDTQVIDGITAHFTGTTAFTLNGTVYKAKEIQRLLQDRIDAAAITTAARAKWITAAADEEAKATEAESVLASLKNHLLVAYGPKSQVVADFGFTPKKKKPADAATTALAVEQRTATRKARGTMPKAEKLKIKGTVPGAATPTAAASPPPTPSATPASPAPPATSGAAPAASG